MSMVGQFRGQCYVKEDKLGRFNIYDYLREEKYKQTSMKL